jgi:Putative zinc-finger
VKDAPAATLRNRVASRRSSRNAGANRHAPNLYRSEQVNKQCLAKVCARNQYRHGLVRYIRPCLTSPASGFLAHAPTDRFWLRDHRDWFAATRMVTPDRDDGGRCEAVRALSFAVCDGELTADALVMIETHLIACAPCRAYCAADAVFVRVVRSAATLDAAPQSLRDRVAQLFQPHAAENASL